MNSGSKIDQPVTLSSYAVASQLNAITTYLGKFITSSADRMAVELQNIEISQMQELVSLCERIDLSALDGLFDAKVIELKSKGVGFNPDNANENIFAKYYAARGQHPIDGTLFDPSVSFEEVIKSAFNLTHSNAISVNQEGKKKAVYSGQERNHANTEATQAYEHSLVLDYPYLNADEHEAVLTAKNDPIANLIELRSRHVGLNSNFKDLAVAGRKWLDSNDPDEKEEAALNIVKNLNLVLQFNHKLVPLLIRSFPAELAQVMKPLYTFSKPQEVMSVSDFQKNTASSRFAFRPKAFKEIDAALKRLQSGQGHNTFFRKNSAYVELEVKIKLALEDPNMDKKRIDGLRELYKQVHSHVTFNEMQSSQNKVIYGNELLKATIKTEIRPSAEALEKEVKQLRR